MLVIGDVRAGLVKRVGGAIGEGAAVFPQIHHYLGTAQRAACSDLFLQPCSFSLILAVLARDEAPSKRKLDGQVTKFEANLAAIETPRQLEVGRCQLTAVERVKLVRHTG